MFADGTVPTALRLTGSVTYPSGTLHLVYETAGVQPQLNTVDEAEAQQRLQEVGARTAHS